MEQQEQVKVGFALASPAVRAHLGAKGGRTAHARGTAHKWTRESAIEAGRKGGTAGAARRRAVAAAQLGALTRVEGRTTVEGAVLAAPGTGPVDVALPWEEPQAAVARPV